MNQDSRQSVRTDSKKHKRMAAIKTLATTGNHYLGRLTGDFI